MTLAFVFPGQGSQSLGMLAEIGASYPTIKETFAEASTALNFDLWTLIQQGPPDTLNKTEFTQPALLTASVALWRVWNEHNGQLPNMLAGHSLGEYSALVCAGALMFVDAVRLVQQRGQFMQAAVAPGIGAMAAILGLNDQQVAETCVQASVNEALVTPANFNSPGQVAIAGNTAAVERAAEIAKTIGARKVVMLAVSVPSHCALMQPAAEHLQQALADINFSTPKIACVNNVNVTIENDIEKIKIALVKQLVSPVRWVETIEKMAANGVTNIVECGPGRILTGLNKRIAKNLQYSVLNTPENLITLLETLK